MRLVGARGAVGLTKMMLVSGATSHPEASPSATWRMVSSGEKRIWVAVRKTPAIRTTCSGS